MPAERFVVLTLPRSGSHHLCGLLDSHPDVLCHQEVFNPDDVWYSPRFSKKYDPAWTDVAARDADRTGFLDKVWHAEEGHASIGLKLFFHDHPSLLDAVFGDPSVAIVVLWRRNLLRAWTSWEIAQRNEIWNSIERSKLENVPRVTLDFDVRQFLAYAQKRQRAREDICRRLAELDHPFIEITYEDLARGAAIHEVTAFLGLDPAPTLTSPYLRIGSSDLAMSYRDFAPVSQALASSSMAWMLHDEGIGD